MCCMPSGVVCCLFPFLSLSLTHTHETHTHTQTLSLSLSLSLCALPTCFSSPNPLSFSPSLMSDHQAHTVFVLLKSSRRLRSTRPSTAPPGLRQVGQPIGMLHEHGSIVVVESQPCDAPTMGKPQPVNGAHARHSVVCVGERGGGASAKGRWYRGQQMHEVARN